MVNHHYAICPQPTTVEETWVSSIHAEHLFALKVVVIGNQLTYLKATFVILKAPNPTGQPACLEKLSLTLPNPTLQ